MSKSAVKLALEGKSFLFQACGIKVRQQFGCKSIPCKILSPSFGSSFWFVWIQSAVNIGNDFGKLFTVQCLGYVFHAWFILYIFPYILCSSTCGSLVASNELLLERNDALCLYAFPPSYNFFFCMDLLFVLSLSLFFCPINPRQAETNIGWNLEAQNRTCFFWWGKNNWTSAKHT